MNNEVVDAVHYATQIGRLDFLSAILASLAIILAVGGLFAFLHFKSAAKEQAEKTAKKVAHRVAEFEANVYLQRELPKIFRDYKEAGFLDPGINDADADAMASSQEMTK